MEMITTDRQFRMIPLVRAVAYGKVQERNSKIEGSTFNLPTWACNTGSKLAKVAGSVCEKCYATAIEKGIRGATVRLLCASV